MLQLVGVYLPSSPPVPDSPGIPFDKLVHAAIFALPALLAPFALGRARDIRVLWALVLVHAPVSELLQAQVLPHRSGDWTDALADIVGVVLGAAASAAMGRGRFLSAGKV